MEEIYLVYFMIGLVFGVTSISGARYYDGGSFWATVFFWPLVVYEYLRKIKFRIELPSTKRERQAQEAIYQEKLRQEREREIQIRKRENEEKENRKKNKIWNSFYRLSQKGKFVASMSGIEFERFVARLLVSMGYAVKLTNITGDQGVDIIATNNSGKKIAVQTKRWKSSVGNSAIQEIIAGKMYYGCSEGWVVISSEFTSGAKDLAKKDSTIKLIDGHELDELISQYANTKIPPFDENKYFEVASQYKALYPKKKKSSNNRWRRKY